MRCSTQSGNETKSVTESPRGVTPSAASQLVSSRKKFRQPPSIYYVLKNAARSGPRSHLLFKHAPIHPGSRTMAMAAAPKTMIANGVPISPVLGSSCFPFPNAMVRSLMRRETSGLSRLALRCSSSSIASADSVTSSPPHLCEATVLSQYLAFRNGLKFPSPDGDPCQAACSSRSCRRRTTQEPLR